MRNKKISPYKIIGTWMFFLISIALPPMMLVSVPLVIWMTVRTWRRVALVRRSRDFYIEERNLMDASKLWRGR